MAVLAVSVVCYQKVVAKDLVAVYLPSLLHKAPELQVRLKYCVVNKVSIFLIITLVSSGQTLSKNIYVLSLYLVPPNLGCCSNFQFFFLLIITVSYLF